MLLVIDTTDVVIAVLDNLSDESCPFWNAIHLEKFGLNNTLDFEIPGDHATSLLVIEGNQIAFKDLDGVIQLFEIISVDETHSEQLIKKIHCENAYYELIDEFVESRILAGATPSVALDSLLTWARWERGTIEVGGSATFTCVRESALAGIFNLIETYGGELRFRITIVANTITHRYVDVLTRRGAVTGKRFEYSKDITDIRRVVDSQYLKTAMFGYGKSSEDSLGDTVRVDFKTEVWTTPGDPANKPSGEAWVEDATALALYGRDGGTRHRYGVYENGDYEVSANLLQATWDYLQTVNTPRITYELNVVDLEEITGLQAEAVRLGDTVSVIDTVFQPQLRVQARVIEISRNLSEPENGSVILGNFITDLSDNGVAITNINQTISDKGGVWDDKFSAATGVPTTVLQGAIDILQNEIEGAATSYLYITETDGLLVMDAPTKALATKAIRIKAGIFAISNAKLAGEFVYRTFGTGDGFTADEITAGTINGVNLILGGIGNISGTFQVLDIAGAEVIRIDNLGLQIIKDGETVASLTADDFGFSELTAATINSPSIQNVQSDNLTYYVNSSTGLDSNTGLSTVTAFKTINRAFTDANKVLLGDTVFAVNVAAGTYTENILMQDFVGGKVTLDFPASTTTTTLNGTINVNNCNSYVVVTGGRSSQTALNGTLINYNSATRILLIRSKFVEVWGFIITGDSVGNGIVFKQATNGYIANCDISRTDRAIQAEANSLVTIDGNSGSTNLKGISAVEGSTINLPTGIIAPTGTANSFTSYAGRIYQEGTVTYQASYNSPPAAPTIITGAWAASNSNSYRQDATPTWRADNQNIYQGVWSGYEAFGNNRGCFWFSGVPWASITTVHSARLRLRRSAAGGYGSTTPIFLHGISLTGPVGTPSSIVDYGQVGSYIWGETKYITIQSGATGPAQDLNAGTIAGFMFYSGPTNYCIFDGYNLSYPPILEITYE